MSKYSVSSVTNGDQKLSQTLLPEINKSTFLRPMSHLTTFQAGQAVPFYLDEVLPGDTMEVECSSLVRLITPLFPTMDNLEMDVYFFYVPHRILWDGWKSFMGESQSQPWVDSSPPMLIPSVFNNTPVQTGSIMNRYGLPIGLNMSSGITGAPTPISALPFMGYKAIHNRWFRDQNVSAPTFFKLGAGSTTYTQDGNEMPLFVYKKGDYFTSSTVGSWKPRSTIGASPVPDFLNYTGLLTLGTPQALAGTLLTSTNPVGLDRPTIPTTIPQVLRSAFQLQKYLERQSRCGTRYIEILKAHFGVHANDYWLQDPELLSHYSETISLSQVPQTSETTDVSPLGQVGAYSLTVSRGKKFKKTFIEHGYMHGIVVVRKKAKYQQGVERHWFRRSREDIYSPEFAHITEQPVLVREIYWDNSLLTGSNTNNRVFGFQEAWADYRMKISRVSGQMSSQSTENFDFMHYADNYNTPPYLTNDWLKDNTQEVLNRTIAVPGGASDSFFAEFYVVNKSTRPMPVFSIPEYTDHF